MCQFEILCGIDLPNSTYFRLNSANSTFFYLSIFLSIDLSFEFVCDGRVVDGP